MFLGRLTRETCLSQGLQIGVDQARERAEYEVWTTLQIPVDCSELLLLVTIKKCHQRSVADERGVDDNSPRLLQKLNIDW